MSKVDFAIGIGGAAGQRITTPGNILVRIFARRGRRLRSNRLPIMLWKRSILGEKKSKSDYSGKRDDLPALEELEPVLEEASPLAYRVLGISKYQAQELIREI